ncbi:DUF2497 domain-containing protein [Dongia sp.]|uniref:DUF2497 domain-containing protein n=1 Tax=Dongia sp. TaxID=1977262 RepID=UPI0035B086B9
MSDAKGNQEPSMEEILASIRRIISEDGEPKEQPAPAVNGHAPEEPAEAEAEADDDDALVLTDMVVGDSNVVELKEEPAAPPAPPPAKAAEPAPPPMPEPEPEPEAEPMPEPEPEPEIQLEPEPVALASLPEPEPVAPAPIEDIELDVEEPMAPQAAAAPSMGSEEEGDLVSPGVAAASAATMAQLVARKAVSTSQRASAIDGLLVETLVRQAIEPMLKDWLDEHLQEIVERLVRREVERLSRKAELS